MLNQLALLLAICILPSLGRFSTPVTMAQLCFGLTLVWWFLRTGDKPAIDDGAKTSSTSETIEQASFDDSEVKNEPAKNEKSSRSRDVQVSINQTRVTNGEEDESCKTSRAGSYTQYSVCLSTGHQVWRRYSRFRRLNGELAAEFPSEPKMRDVALLLPSKQWLPYIDVVATRRVGLQKYLRKIFSIRKMRQSSAIARFLGTQVDRQPVKDDILQSDDLERLSSLSYISEVGDASSATTSSLNATLASRGGETGVGLCSPPHTIQHATMVASDLELLQRMQELCADSQFTGSNHTMARCFTSCDEHAMSTSPAN